jgi:hypothetical protein
VLQSDAGMWDDGIYLVSGAGASTTPFYVDWIRVYKEVPSATPRRPRDGGVGRNGWGEQVASQRKASAPRRLVRLGVSD